MPLVRAGGEVARHVMRQSLEAPSYRHRLAAKFFGSCRGAANTGVSLTNSALRKHASPSESLRGGCASERNMSMLNHFYPGTRRSESFSSLSDGDDEAARAAILEKLMKGRQPSDLMLRCPCRFTFLIVLNSPHDLYKRYYFKRKRWVSWLAPFFKRFIKLNSFGSQGM